MLVERSLVVLLQEGDVIKEKVSPLSAKISPLSAKETVKKVICNLQVGALAKAGSELAMAGKLTPPQCEDWVLLDDYFILLVKGITGESGSIGHHVLMDELDRCRGFINSRATQLSLPHEKQDIDPDPTGAYLGLGGGLTTD